MNINKLASVINKCQNTKEARLNIPENVKIVGNGSRRIVIQCPENPQHVFKLAMWNGIEHNKNEIEIYNKAKSKGISEYLCPIEDYDNNYKWIKMPYIDTIDTVGHEKVTGPKSDQIHKILKSNDIDLYELETARHKDNTIAYDYGQLK